MRLERRIVTPVLRWAGGKRWLIPLVDNIFRSVDVRSYVEPFLGGGAIYFAFSWPRAVLGDLNPDLMSTYRGIRQDVPAVRSAVRTIPVSKSHYERIRLWQPETDVKRAARLIYLNRCAYGGIYRTDRHGVYNVPYSGDRSTSTLLRTTRLELVSAALRGASLLQCDFEETIEQAGPGSLLFCDPVYSLPEAEGRFRRYGSPAYSWADQERLAGAVQRAVRRGALAMICNSPDPRVADLYSDARVCHFKRRSAV